MALSEWRVSFVDTMRYLAERLKGLNGVAELLLVPLRPGRYEPRVIRRRMKAYDLLKVPRQALKHQQKQRENA